MPQLCRFLNSDIPDIARESKDEEFGQNLFAYCCNDPVNNVDPTGLFVWLISGFRTNKKGFRVEVDKRFLSRPFCKLFAKVVISFYGKGSKYKRMDTHRIEVELWAHAIGYYAGRILKKANKNWGENLIKSGMVINVNNDDKQAWKYYALWNAGTAVKIAILSSRTPAIVKIASYVIL